MGYLQPNECEPSSPFSNTHIRKIVHLSAWGRPVWEMDKMQGYGGVVGWVGSIKRRRKTKASDDCTDGRHGLWRGVYCAADPFLLPLSLPLLCILFSDRLLISAASAKELCLYQARGGTGMRFLLSFALDSFLCPWKIADIPPPLLVAGGSTSFSLTYVLALIFTGYSNVRETLIHVYLFQRRLQRRG